MSVKTSPSIARTVRLSATLATLLCAGATFAQPTLTSLGSGTPLGVSNPQGSIIYVSGAAGSTALRWVANGGSMTRTDLVSTGGSVISADGSIVIGTQANSAPSIVSNSATGVTPPFSLTPTLVPAAISATDNVGAYWNEATGTWTRLPGFPVVPSQMIYGTGSGGNSTYNISQNGRFIVGRGNISSYNSSAGTTISIGASVFRPWIFDRQANGGLGAYTMLETPFRTSSNTWRRRTGEAYAVSNDGTVVIGGQEHNVATTTTADPDGARPIVWRLNSGTGNYDRTFLPNGRAFTRVLETDTPTLIGPNTASFTNGSWRMNAAGTIIVGPSVSDTITTTNGPGTADDVTTFSGGGMAKWTWNSTTSSWDGPVLLSSTPMAAASWLPVAVTSCGVPPQFFISGMSDDGNIVVGQARYSTCGSFMSGGFIWTDPSISVANGGTNGLIVDWYDYLVSRSVPDVTSQYGPTGDNGDPSRGLPKLGFPSAISPDGTVVAGFQGGNQLIPGAVPWVLRPASLSGCVAPTIISNPVATAVFSRCTNPILNVSAFGSLPISYQWYKDGSPVSNGTTAAGGTISGATETQFRLNNAKPGDAGTYYCIATGSCGTPVQFTSTVISPDPAAPAIANDTLATALAVGEGTFTYNLCGAYVDDTFSLFPGSCTSSTTTGDVWYTYTPTFTGEARIETCGSNFDTIVTVFDGTGNEVACNDDYLTGTAASCAAQRSRVARLPVAAGSPLTIRVVIKSASIFSFSSTGSLRIVQAPAPAAGDQCSAPIPAVSGANAFDTTEATNSGDNPSCGVAANLNTRDVWFSYTPARSGTIRVSTCPGTSYDTVLSIHQACGGGDIACSDNVAAGVCGTGTSTQSVISGFPLTGGQSYLIRVGGKALANFGPGVMTLTYSPTPCTASDVAGADQSIGADGALTADDIIVFLGWFFLPDARADVAGENQSAGADGQYTADDIIVFLNRYFAGC